jgi:hypothetical protein
LIYTTNTIEGSNRQLRKVTKNKGVFPTDDGLFNMLYLAMVDITKSGPEDVKIRVKYILSSWFSLMADYLARLLIFNRVRTIIIHSHADFGLYTKIWVMS